MSLDTYVLQNTQLWSRHTLWWPRNCMSSECACLNPSSLHQHHAITSKNSHVVAWQVLLAGKMRYKRCFLPSTSNLMCYRHLCTEQMIHSATKDSHVSARLGMFHNLKPRFFLRFFNDRSLSIKEAHRHLQYQHREWTFTWLS